MTPAARLWRVHGLAAVCGWAMSPEARATAEPLPRPASADRGIDVSRLPAPGTYRLPRLMAAPDGEVLDTRGRPQRLRALLAGRLSVVSFMYTYCRDPLGCPLAWHTLDTLQAALRADAALARQAQLVSLSFDPSNDQPQQMALFAGGRERDAAVRWHFLTTRSVARLMPLLDGFGQGVSVETDAQGRATRTLNHMLKLFLVDAESQVREVYSVATLSPQAIVNDLRTLTMPAWSPTP